MEYQQIRNNTCCKGSTFKALCLIAGLVFAFSISGFASDQYPSTKKVGYEILQFKSFNEIVAWVSTDITREQFMDLKLPFGWFKNQPREVDMDSAQFLNSPGLKEGEFKRVKHFGFEWIHAASVKKTGIRLDTKRRLIGSRVQKDHVITFNKGRVITLLISPEGDIFPRITRDADRKQESPTIPEKWRLIDYTLNKKTEFKLTGITTVIRTNNHDSFQGPVEMKLEHDLVK